MHKIHREIRKALIDLTVFWLENIVYKKGNHFYKQSKEVITSDKISVSIANIALHHVIMSRK